MNERSRICRRTRPASVRTQAEARGLGRRTGRVGASFPWNALLAFTIREPTNRDIAEATIERAIDLTINCARMRWTLRTVAGLTPLKQISHGHTECGSYGLDRVQ